MYGNTQADLSQEEITTLLFTWNFLLTGESGYMYKLS